MKNLTIISILVLLAPYAELHSLPGEETFITTNGRQPQATGLANSRVLGPQRARFGQQAIAQASAPMAAQASFSANIYSEPPAGLAPQIGVPREQPAAGMSNIEQLMKNALARTAQLNSAAAAAAGPSQPVAEARQDRAEPAPPSPRAAESPATETPGAEENTTPALAMTTANHETVYSDQRFANLFARRNQLKKSRIQPSEQVRAKPTLPSFIKTAPDPKQFTASLAEGSEPQDVRRPLGQPSPANPFGAQRLQQAGQSGRLGSAPGQQKKAALTSSSAASASGKRANSPANKPTSANPSSLKASATGNRTPSTGNMAAATGVKPQAINPFNRAQNNDPATVIAMARKRLLANNALESAKLKQQQQQQQKASPSSTSPNSR